jgi:tape measure domain-containing protein
VRDLQDVQIMVRVVNRASGQLQAVARDAERMGHSFKASQIAFQYLQFQAFAGLMAIQVGLVASAKAGFEFNSQMELMLMRWTNITGSAEKGQAMVDMFRQIVKETALTTEQISSFANRLLQAGIPVDELEGKLMGLANIQAKYGLSNEEAQRFVLGFTQSLSKGKLQAEEMNQMLEAGVPIYQILQDEFGWTREEVHNLGKDADKTKQALAFLNGEFLEGTTFIDAYAGTMVGVLNRFKDAWVAFSGALQEDIFQNIKGYIQSFSGYLERVTEDIRAGSGKWEAIWNNMSTKVQENLTKAKNALMIFFAYNVASKLVTMGAGFVTLAQKIGTVGAMFARLHPAVALVTAILAGLILGIMKLVEWYNRLKDAFPVLQETFTIFKQTIGEMIGIIVDLIATAFEPFAGTLDTNREKVLFLLEAMRLGFVVFGGFVVAIGVIIDAFMILYHTTHIVVQGLALLIRMMGALALAMVGDIKGATELAKSAMSEFKTSTGESINAINEIITGNGMGNKLYAEMKSGLDKANIAIDEFKNGTGTAMSQVSDSVTGAGELSSVGFGKIKQGSATANSVVRVQAQGMGTSMLQAGTKAQEAGAKVKDGLLKGGEGAKQGATKVKGAGKDIESSMSQMASGAEKNAPRVGKAVLEAGNKAQTEASKLPPKLRTTGAKATTEYAGGIKSKEGSVRDSARAVGNAGGEALASLNWSKYGSALIRTFAQGITGAAGWAVTAVTNVVSMVRRLIPSSDAKTGPLSDLTWSGGKFVTTFADGIYKKQGYLVKATNDVMQKARNSLESEVGAPMFANQQTITVNHIHQGKVDVVGNNSPSQANQFVGNSIGYETDANGVRRNIRARGGS